jgi:predicted  nucleic acid-binding Zn-ribbon protein
VIKDLEALLAVQADDAHIRELATKVADVGERERVLDEERSAATSALERTRGSLEREEAKRDALQARVEQHRQLHQRNVAQMDQVKRIREATAAQAQIDMARQILNDEERELQSLSRRIDDLRQAMAAHESAAAEIEERQAEARAALASERATLQGELEEERRRRDEKASVVPRTLLTRYERIRDRRQGEAVFPLRGMACSSCDTAIPLQRRNLMADGAQIEVCEACGVLLYAARE